MSPFCLSTLKVLLALSHIFVLHWSLVSCKLQHDPGGSMDFYLHDTKAVIGKYFNYSIPTPSRIAKHALLYEVLEVGTSTIPSWLVFNHSSHSFHGVPLITDKGFYLMKVSLRSLSENASSLQAHDVFAIDVDFETSQELTRRDILEGVGARPHQLLYTVKQLSEDIACRRNEIKTLMSVVFDADINRINGSGRISLISQLASFVNQPFEEFRISSKHSSVINKLQADTVVAAGPGNIHSAGSREGVVVSWPLPCASQTLINQFPKVMARNIASGHFRDATGYDVISWHISKAKYNDEKARGRSRRQAVMTVVPTPKPSQTASVITASSILPVSSTVQSMQTLLTSSLVSTLLFSPSSSDQTMSLFLSRTSGFILPTTPLDSPSVSLYSPSQSLQTLSSVVTESIQPSLSQSPFMTNLSISLLSSTTATFSSSMPVSQFSPTSQQMTTSLSSHQTPFYSTAGDISGSTIGLVSSSLQMSTNVISHSTSVFPNFQSTSSLLGSPSLFLSTEIISASVFVTESPSVSSVESIQLSDSVTTAMMLSSQSSTNALSATSGISHLSSVFSSHFPTTLQSSEPETSVILQTSSSTRSESLLLSTRVSRTSLILSSTLIGTSVFETVSSVFEIVSSIRYTSTEISTAFQTTLTPPSTLLSTRLPFSSQILTSSLSSSERILSSIESLQTLSGLISTSFAKMSSRSSLTPMISTETSLSLQIQSSSLSTYQTELFSSVLTTALGSAEVSVTQNISVASTALPTSPVQSEIRTSDIVQSMTVLPTATIVSLVTMSSSDFASPGTPFTASATSTSVPDTFSQLVPSTLVMTPSLSGMVSSSFVVPDVTSVSSVIEVSTLSSSEDTTLSPSLHTDDLSSTAMFIESTYLSEFLSSAVAPDTSSLSPSLPPESPSLTLSFLHTTLSSSLAFLTTTFPFSTSVMTSQIQSSYISRTGISMIPTTLFQTPVISTISATTLMTGGSTFVSLGTPSFSESSLMISLLSSSNFPVHSPSLTPSSTSANSFISSAPSVSLPRSEQSMGTSQDTPTFSTSMLFTLDSSSATDFPVSSTLVTPTSVFVSFASSTPPGVSSVSDSLAPSEFTTASIQKSTSLGLESDYSSTTLFFSEGKSETLIPSFFVTSTSQQFALSSSATQRSSFSQSDVVSSTVIQPSVSSTYLLTSSVGFPSTQDSSTAQIISSATSSETPDLSSSFSDSQTTAVQSIASSLSETLSLVSTMSPPLSTPSQLMSTRAPSSLLSSTQGVFISSSPSPTPSSPVPSTIVVMPSGTITLSSGPTVPLPSSTTGQTSFLSSLPNSDVSLPMSTLFVSTSDIQPTPSSSSPVDVVSTPPSTTELTTPPETTTEPGNQAPVIQHPIDEIIVALGDVLQFSIPEDTFLDAEDGLTFDLQLDLLTPDNQPVSPSHWLQLVNSQRTLAGVPLDTNLTITRNEYLLSATDSEGLVAYDAFVVKVQERALDYSHEFVLTLENDFQSFFDDSQNMISLCDSVGSFLNDQNADAFSVASVTEGSVVMTYSNKTIPTKYCDYEAIDDVFSSLAYANGTPTNAFQDALLPNYAVTDVERIFLHLCSATTVPPFTNVTEYPATGTNLLLVTLLPASLIAFLLLICFLIFCCCYKHKRGGEEFLLHEEKPVYAKNRKPIYLDGELDDKEPRAASHPIILPIDVDPVKASHPFKGKSYESSLKARPLPPQYRLPDYAQVNLGMDDFEDDFENNLFEMEPPTYTSQPVLHIAAADSKPLDDRPPPLYRLPPPYQSQDRGFFEESDI